MKPVLAIFLLLLINTISLKASEDFYRDEYGRTYSIGIYGERVYEEDDGQPNPKKQSMLDFNSQEDFSDFGWKLFQNTDTEKLDNYVTSSLSPQLLLSLVAVASKNETRRQIYKSIKKENYLKLGELIKRLQSEDSTRELDVATAFFISDEFSNELHPQYNQMAKNSSIDILFMNFANPRLLQEKYNTWIQKKTRGNLGTSQLDIDPRSRMVLTSALYFKGDWLFAFDKTTKGQFYVPSIRRDIEVPMMLLEMKKFHYGFLSDGIGEWLAIPYNSTDAMVILLPKQGLSVEKMIKQTPTSDVTDIINIIGERAHPNTLVNITLPKFKIDSVIGLNDPLRKMGIQRLFTEQAQFYPLNKDTPLQVSSAIQQSSLEITETGSIGSSASKFSVTALSVQAPVTEANFVVNRPFVAIIVNRLYHIPYFVAKVSDPRRTY